MVVFYINHMCTAALASAFFFQEAFVFSMLEDDAHPSMVCPLLLYLLAKVLLLGGLS